MPTEFELINIDPEDANDLLIKVERSFDIRFDDGELKDVLTFGELCDKIEQKIQLHHTNDCTSQQAFYKLREAISTVLDIDKKSITTNSSLTDLLPKHSRRSVLKKLEDKIGFKLNILRPSHYITISLIIVLLVSIVFLFIHWKLGLVGLIFAFFGFKMADKYGNELDLDTVGQMAEKMARENYILSRRNSNTFNKYEIEKVLVDWFSKEFHLDKTKLTREARFS